ncbi:MAG: hypothetical protein WCH76_00395, partial [Candidatus Riflemargulisbacteria bacterium]
MFTLAKDTTFAKFSKDYESTSGHLQPFYWQIYLYDEVGNIAKNTYQQFKIDVTPPPSNLLPSDFTVTLRPGGSGSPSIAPSSWFNQSTVYINVDVPIDKDTGSGVDNRKLYSVTRESNPSMSEIISPYAWGYIANPLIASDQGVHYNLFVKLVDNVGNESNDWQKVTELKYDPLSPGNPEYIYGNHDYPYTRADNQSITFSFGEAQDTGGSQISKYSFYVYDVYNNQKTVVLSIPTAQPNTPYEVTGIGLDKNEHKYEPGVDIYDNAGNRTFVAGTAVLVDRTSPDMVINPRVTARTESNVNLSWQEPLDNPLGLVGSGVGSYELSFYHVSADGITAESLFLSTNVTDTQIQLSIPLEIDFIGKIVAVDRAGNKSAPQVIRQLSVDFFNPKNPPIATTKNESLYSVFSNDAIQGLPKPRAFAGGQEDFFHLIWMPGDDEGFGVYGYNYSWVKDSVPLQSGFTTKRTLNLPARTNGRYVLWLRSEDFARNKADVSDNAYEFTVAFEGGVSPNRPQAPTITAPLYTSGNFFTFTMSNIDNKGVSYGSNPQYQYGVYKAHHVKEITMNTIFSLQPITIPFSILSPNSQYYVKYRVISNNTYSGWSYGSDYIFYDTQSPLTMNAPLIADASQYVSSAVQVVNFLPIRDAFDDNSFYAGSGISRYDIAIYKGGVTQNMTPVTIDELFQKRQVHLDSTASISLENSSQGATYSVRVRAVDNAGNIGGWSEESNVVIWDSVETNWDNTVVRCQVGETASRTSYEVVSANNGYVKGFNFNFEWYSPTGGSAIAEYEYYYGYTDMNGLSGLPSSPITSLNYYETGTLNANVKNVVLLGGYPVNLGLNLNPLNTRFKKNSGSVSGDVKYFCIRAKDIAGNKNANWTRKYTTSIDRYPPERPIFTSPLKNIVTSQNNFQFTWTSPGDVGGGLVDKVSLKVYKVEVTGTWNDYRWTRLEVFSSSNMRSNFYLLPVTASGTYYAEINVSDNFGNGIRMFSPEDTGVYNVDWSSPQEFGSQPRIDLSNFSSFVNIDKTEPEPEMAPYKYLQLFKNVDADKTVRMKEVLNFIDINAGGLKLNPALPSEVVRRWMLFTSLGESGFGGFITKNWDNISGVIDYYKYGSFPLVSVDAEIVFNGRLSTLNGKGLYTDENLMSLLITKGHIKTNRFLYPQIAYIFEKNYYDEGLFNSGRIVSLNNEDQNNGILGFNEIDSIIWNMYDLHYHPFYSENGTFSQNQTTEIIRIAMDKGYLVEGAEVSAPEWHYRVGTNLRAVGTENAIENILFDGENPTIPHGVICTTDLYQLSGASEKVIEILVNNGSIQDLSETYPGWYLILGANDIPDGLDRKIKNEIINNVYPLFKSITNDCRAMVEAVINTANANYDELRVNLADFLRQYDVLNPESYTLASSDFVNMDGFFDWHFNWLHEDYMNGSGISQVLVQKYINGVANGLPVSISVTTPEFSYVANNGSNKFDVNTEIKLNIQDHAGNWSGWSSLSGNSGELLTPEQGYNFSQTTFRPTYPGQGESPDKWLSVQPVNFSWSQGQVHEYKITDANGVHSITSRSIILSVNATEGTKNYTVVGSNFAGTDASALRALLYYYDKTKPIAGSTSIGVSPYYKVDAGFTVPTYTDATSGIGSYLFSLINIKDKTVVPAPPMSNASYTLAVGGKTGQKFYLQETAIDRARLEGVSVTSAVFGVDDKSPGDISGLWANSNIINNGAYWGSAVSGSSFAWMPAEESQFGVKEYIVTIKYGNGDLGTTLPSVTTNKTMLELNKYSAIKDATMLSFSVQAKDYGDNVSRIANLESPLRIDKTKPTLTDPSFAAVKEENGIPNSIWQAVTNSARFTFPPLSTYFTDADSGLNKIEIYWGPEHGRTYGAKIANSAEKYTPDGVMPNLGQVEYRLLIRACDYAGNWTDMKTAYSTKYATYVHPVDTMWVIPFQVCTGQISGYTFTNNVKYEYYNGPTVDIVWPDYQEQAGIQKFYIEVYVTNNKMVANSQAGDLKRVITVDITSPNLFLIKSSLTITTGYRCTITMDAQTLGFTTENEISSKNYYFYVRIENNLGIMSDTFVRSFMFWMDRSTPNRVISPTMDNSGVSVSIVNTAKSLTWNWQSPFDPGGSSVDYFQTFLGSYPWDYSLVSYDQMVTYNLHVTVNNVNSINYSFQASLTDNLYTFYIKACDKAGNSGDYSEGQAVLVDTLAPSLNILINTEYSSNGASRIISGAVYSLIISNNAGFQLFMNDWAKAQTGNVGSGVQGIKLDLFDFKNSQFSTATIKAEVNTFNLNGVTFNFGNWITQQITETSLTKNNYHFTQSAGLARFALISSDLVISTNWLNTDNYIESSVTINLVTFNVRLSDGLYFVRLSVRDWAGNVATKDLYFYTDMGRPTLDKKFSGLIYIDKYYRFGVKTVDGLPGSLSIPNVAGGISQPEGSQTSLINKYFSESNSFINLFPTSNSDDPLGCFYDLPLSKRDGWNYLTSKNYFFPYVETDQSKWGFDFIVVSASARFYLRAYDSSSEELGFYQNNQNRFANSWHNGTLTITANEKLSSVKNKANLRLQGAIFGMKMDNGVLRTTHNIDFDYGWGWDWARDLVQVSINNVVDNRSLTLGVMDYGSNIDEIYFSKAFLSKPITLVTSQIEFLYMDDSSGATANQTYFNRYGGVNNEWRDYQVQPWKFNGVIGANTNNIIVSMQIVVSGEPYQLRAWDQSPIFFSNGTSINPYSGLNATDLAVPTHNGFTLTSTVITYNYLGYYGYSVTENDGVKASPDRNVLSNNFTQQYISVNIPNMYGDSAISIIVTYQIDSTFPTVTMDTYYLYDRLSNIEVERYLGALTFTTNRIIIPEYCITFNVPSAEFKSKLAPAFAGYKEIIFVNTMNAMATINWITANNAGNGKVWITDNVGGIGLPQNPFRYRIVTGNTAIRGASHQRWNNSWEGITSNLEVGINWIDLVWEDKARNYSGTSNCVVVYDNTPPVIYPATPSVNWFPKSVGARKLLFEKPYSSVFVIQPLLPSNNLFTGNVPTFNIDGNKGIRMYFTVYDDAFNEKVLSTNSINVYEFSFVRLWVSRDGQEVATLDFTFDKFGSLVDGKYGIFKVNPVTSFDIKENRPTATAYTANGSSRTPYNYCFFVTRDVIISDNAVFGASVVAHTQSSSYQFRMAVVDYAGNITTTDFSDPLKINNIQPQKLNITVDVIPDSTFNIANARVVTQSIHGAVLDDTALLAPVNCISGNVQKRIYNDGIINFTFRVTVDSSWTSGEQPGAQFCCVWTTSDSYLTSFVPTQFYAYYGYGDINWSITQSVQVGTASFSFDVFNLKPGQNRVTLDSFVDGKGMYVSVNNVDNARIVTNEEVVNFFVSIADSAGNPYNPINPVKSQKWSIITIDLTPPVLQSGLMFDVHAGNLLNKDKGLYIYEGQVSGNLSTVNAFAIASLNTFTSVNNFVYIRSSQISYNIAILSDSLSGVPTNNSYLRSKVYYSDGGATNNRSFSFTSRASSKQYSKSNEPVSANLSLGDGMYFIDNYYANNAGLLTRNSMFVIKDSVPPIINRFNIRSSVSQDYAPATLNFYGSQNLVLSWDAVDDLAVKTSGWLTGSNPKGIWFYELRFDHMDANNATSGYLFCSRNSFIVNVNDIDGTPFVPTICTAITINWDDVSANIFAGKVKLSLYAWDYALNYSVSEMIVYIDTGNALHNSIGRIEPVTDDVDNQGDGVSPSAAGGPGYYDQTEVWVRLYLTRDAFDITQLNTLRTSKHLPIEAFVATGSIPSRVSFNFTTASISRLPAILDGSNWYYNMDAKTGNLGAVVVYVTVDLREVISLNGYQGPVTLSFKLIDGAGYLSITAETKIRVTVDLSAPTGSATFLNGTSIFYNGENTYAYELYGISKNTCFVTTTNVKQELNYNDSHSGLNLDPYRYLFLQKNFGSESIEKSASSSVWEDYSAVSLDSHLQEKFISRNSWYQIVSYIRNKAGIVEVTTRNFIYDTQSPTINNLIVTVNDQGKEYNRSSGNFISKEPIVINWSVSDNAYDLLSEEIFNKTDKGPNYRGIYNYQLFYNKGSNVNPINAGISLNTKLIYEPYLQASLNLTSEDVFNCGEGIISITIVAQDFCNNSSSMNSVFYFLDWSNTLNQQISLFEKATDNVSNVSQYKGFELTPFQAALTVGYYDQTSVNIIIHLSADAQDITQLSYLVGFSHIPLEVYLSTTNDVWNKVASNNIIATYNLAKTITAVNNLANVTISAVIDLSEYIGNDLYQGGVSLSFKLIDGAGNLSATSNQVRVTVDISSPTISFGFIPTDYMLISTEGIFETYGVTINTEFSPTTQVLFTVSAYDEHSGLKVTWNNFSIEKYSLGGSLISTWNTSWQSRPTVSMAEFTKQGSASMNYYYMVRSYVANMAGGVRMSGTKMVILDNTAPTLSSFRTTTQDDGQNTYKPSSINFIQPATLNFEWVVSDNIYSSSPNIFSANSNFGIFKYELKYITSNTYIDIATTSLTVLVPTRTNTYSISKYYLENTIGEQGVTFCLVAYDFAGNVATFNLGPFIFDKTNSLNVQIDRYEAVTDNHDDLGMIGTLVKTPLSASDMSGYYDQTTVDFIIHFTSTANDNTQFSYLPYMHIPVEIFIATANGTDYVMVSSAHVKATYDFTSALFQELNLATMSIFVTVDLRDYISTNNYQGLVKIKSKLIDGAGNLSLTSDLSLSVTVDLTPPTASVFGGVSFNSGFGYQGQDSIRDLTHYGLSMNTIFVSANNNNVPIMMKAIFSDTHSGLPNTFNQFVLLSSNLSVLGTVDSTESGVAILSINVVPLVPNNLYNLFAYAWNNVGAITKGSTFNIIFDIFPPTVISFNLEIPLGDRTAYPKSDDLFAQAATVTVKYDVTDNIVSSSVFSNSRQLIHKGIHHFDMSYKKLDGPKTPVLADQMVSNDSQIGFSSIILSKDFVLQYFSEKKISINIDFFDFAYNKGSASIGPLIFDAVCTLNSQLGRIYASDNSDEDLLGGSPISIAGGLGYFDSPTTTFVLEFSENANDLTQLSYLTMNHIPIEIMFTTSDVERLSTATVFVTYNAQDMRNNLNDPTEKNLGGLTINVTFDMAAWIGVNTYQGPVTISFRFIDGAGNLDSSSVTANTYRITVDLTPPTGSADFVKEDYAFIATRTYQEYGVPTGTAFANQNNILRVVAMYSDSHSGMPEERYNYEFRKYTL